MSKFASIALTTETPYRVNLVLPDGSPLLDSAGTQMWIEVLSSDSRKAREQMRTQIDNRIAGKKANAESVESDGIDALAKLTAGWHIELMADGEPKELAFSLEQARELYGEPALGYVLDQVSVASSKRANFMPAPKKL